MTEHVPRRVLVTGGAGFIGSCFVRRLIAGDPGVRVVTLDLLTYAGRLANLDDLSDASRHSFVQGDIGDEALVRGLLEEHDVDTIVHFAAESHVDRSIDAPARFVETNIVGTFRLLEAARRAWQAEGRTGRASSVRFHHVLTDEVYGFLGPGDPPSLETSPYRPRSPYSASKAASDHLVSAYHHTYGLPVTLTNSSNNYGPRQNDEKFIPTVIRSCLAGTPVPVYGTGENVRDWLFVEDCCAAIERVVRRGAVGATYNVGGHGEVPNLVLAREICALLDELSPGAHPYRDLIRFVADRPGHDFRYALDGSRLRNELGWQPATRLAEGLRATVEWYLRRSVG